MKFVAVVEVTTSGEVTRARVAEYIRSALASEKGALRPEDPMKAFEVAIVNSIDIADERS